MGLYVEFHCVINFDVAGSIGEGGSRDHIQEVEIIWALIFVVCDDN